MKYGKEVVCSTVQSDSDANADLLATEAMSAEQEIDLFSANAADWLKRNIMTRYWTSISNSNVASGDRSSIAVDWLATGSIFMILQLNRIFNFYR